MRLRSVLYIPANKPRALAKAAHLDCDAVIVDLEDAVDPQHHAQALASLPEYWPGLNKPVWLRLQWQSARAAELEILTALQVAQVILPKVEHPAVLAKDIETLHGVGVRSVWGMLETPAGVVHSAALAAMLDGIVVGSNDLAKALRLPQYDNFARVGMEYALQQMVLAARAAEIPIIDGVCTQLDNDAALQAQAEQGKYWGFDGKSLIHPRQIAICNQVFMPTEAEIAWARSVVSAWQQRDGDVVQVDGRLVEALHVAQAEALLGTRS